MTRRRKKHIRYGRLLLCLAAAASLILLLCLLFGTRRRRLALLLFPSGMSDIIRKEEIISAAETAAQKKHISPPIVLTGAGGDKNSAEALVRKALSLGADTLLLWGIDTSLLPDAASLSDSQRYLAVTVSAKEQPPLPEHAAALTYTPEAMGFSAGQYAARAGYSLPLCITAETKPVSERAVNGFLQGFDSLVPAGETRQCLTAKIPSAESAGLLQERGFFGADVLFMPDADMSGAFVTSLPVFALSENKTGQTAFFIRPDIDRLTETAVSLLLSPSRFRKAAGQYTDLAVSTEKDAYFHPGGMIADTVPSGSGHKDYADTSSGENTLPAESTDRPFLKNCILTEYGRIDP